MTVEVALAMLERQGRWLLQLRDDIEGIVYPGTWALFGGHLEAAESPEVALRRELLEEINWQASHLNFWFDHRDPHRTAYFFRSQLDVPLAELTLLEGQDLVLAELKEIRSGKVWSPKCGENRLLAPSLKLAVLALERELGLPPGLY
ncbi:MAG: hypothetical protein RLZZ158_669 [Cyanobacteriota bacterium]|jgi:8-oxo-dGTP diphosphatase